jgi:hypothetical protein
MSSSAKADRDPGLFSCNHLVIADSTDARSSLQCGRRPSNII